MHMRPLRTVPAITLLLLSVVASCSSDSKNGEQNSDPASGGSASGGAIGTGGASAVGETNASGGGDASGGALGSGGLAGVGGNLGLGGETGTGGSLEGSGGSNPSGARFPFPQNAPSAHCVFPSNYDNADVRAAYDVWKETVVTSGGASGHLRVRKPDSGTQIDSTVSEGIGYGLLLSAYMDDQEVFDGIWKYEQLYINANGLMNWEVSAEGQVIGTGAALDGDEDMAWALIMADRQWGGQGSLERPYIDYAIELIQAIWDHEIDHTRGDMPLPGDAWGGADVTNISYFAPAYYRVFGQISDMEEEWGRVIDRSYEIIEASLNAASGNEANGLVPAWCNSAGEPVVAYDGAPTHYQNDSTRTPFRVGQDYCYFGEPRALAYIQKTTNFFKGVGVENIVDGYELDGTPRPDFGANGLGSASFVGPAAVGASYSTENQLFIDEAYTALASQDLTAGTIYYQKSWAALSLLMLTGGFFEFPAAPE